MRPTILVMSLVLIGLFYQNCSQNSVSFDHVDAASSLGVGISIVPDKANVREVNKKQLYTAKVHTPEKGKIVREEVILNGAPISFTKNALGNYDFSFNPPIPAKYLILVRVWTPTGTSFEATEVLEIKDDFPPEIVITPNSSNKYEHLPGVFQRFALQVTDKGGGAVQGAECSLNGAPIACLLNASGYAEIVTRNLGGGLYNLTVDAIDTFGNKSSETHSFSIGADLIAPIATITADSNNSGYTIDIQKFVLTAQDAHTGLAEVLCYLNGAPLASCVPLSGGSITLQLTKDALKAGINTLRLVAKDNAIKDGIYKPNGSSVDFSFNMMVDSKKPSVNLTKHYSSSNLVGQVQKFVFEVSDDGSGLIPSTLLCQVNGVAIGCSMDSGGVGEISFTPPTTGPYAVKVSVQDRYRNTGEMTLTADIVKDTNVPIVTITEALTNPALVTPGTPVTFNYTVRKEGNLSQLKEVHCYADGSKVSCAASSLESGQMTVSFPTTGGHSVRVEAYDGAGNMGSASYNITVVQVSPESTALAVNGQSLLDVLIVIDNSGSMAAEQKNMAARISSFTSKLSDIDWRVGVITTDVTATKRGKLLKMSGTSSYWVSAGTPDAQSIIGNTVQGVGISGSGTEQGIAATNYLISSHKNAPNLGFFRDKAGLAVIIISDEDESGAAAVNKPENLTALVQQEWPGKAFKAHGLIGTGAGCPDSDEGRTYKVLVQNTNGEVGCVGDADYGPILEKIGTSSATLVNSVTLKCAPYKNEVVIKKDGQPQTLAGIVFSGANMTFASPLEPGNYSFSYTCVK